METATEFELILRVLDHTDTPIAAVMIYILYRIIKVLHSLDRRILRIETLLNGYGALTNANPDKSTSSS